MTDPITRALAGTPPLLVGAVAAGYGLSSLLLIAAHFGNVPYTVAHPGFWLGDGLALPGTLGTIACYHRHRRNSPDKLPAAAPWLSASTATLYTTFQTAYSVFVTSHYAPPWSLAHSAFIWVLVYAIGHFLFAVAIRHRRGQLVPVELWVVAAGMTLHLLLALEFGAKVRPVAGS